MDVYHQFVDPSTCTSAVHCNFTSATSKNLVISKGTILQLFEVVELQQQDDDDDEASEEAQEIDQVIGNAESFIGDGFMSNLIQQQRYKLSLVSEYRLNGEIIGISKFRSNGNENNDYLIVSTKFAKLSVLKWDIQLHSISTVSLHYYDTALDALSVEKASKCIVNHRTDPNGLCTMLQMNELFTCLPFFRDFLDEEDEGELSDGGKDQKDQTAEPKESRSLSQTQRRKKLYNQSFILNASSLNSDIKNIIDFQFLFSYRDPTVAILYAPETLSWAGYLPRAKDNMKVIVLSLDLETKTTTAIMELNNLPYDLDYIHPLPSPTNGFLLVGSNEIIHVNSLGSLKGIATNEYFADTSNMKLKDQSGLDLFLENCRLELVRNNQVLIITEAGEFYQLKFDNIGGVSTINSIAKIDKAHYKNINLNNPIMIANIEALDSFFVCCQGGDSLLLRSKPSLGALPASAEKTVKSNSNEDDDEWLYDEEDDQQKVNENQLLVNCKFEKMDTLLNCGPLTDFTMGNVSTEPKVMGLPNPNLNEKVIVGASGIGTNSSLCIFNPSIKPIVKSTLKFSNVDKIWTLADSNDQTHYLVTTDFTNFRTQVFQINKNYKNLYTKDFNNKQFTVQFGTISAESETYIVQVTLFKVILFNFKFGEVSSIDYDYEINSASIQDNYVIVAMKNGEIDILEFVDKELKKLDLPALLNYLIFTNGWICETSALRNFGTSSVKRDSSGNPILCSEDTTMEPTFWLVTADNRLLVFKKDHKEKVYEFKDIHKFPEMLQLVSMDPNYEAEVDPIIKQVMFTKLGNSCETKDYLIVLTFGGEIFIYEVFFDPVEGTYKLLKLNELCQFPIIGAPENSYSHATKIERNLINIDNLQGYKAVLVTGYTSFVILKEHSSMPRLFQFTSRPALYFADFNSEKCANGLIAIDDTKACRICQLDTKYNYINRVPIYKAKIGEETIDKVKYYKHSNLYLTSTLKEVPFVALDEDGNTLQGIREDRPTKAGNYKGTVQLVSPSNWSVIDSVEMDDNEVVTSIEVMELMINESNVRKNVVIVGSAQYRVEDLSTNGSWKIYEIIDVVPEPGRPEAKNRLKLITSETAKGPVLSICNVSNRFAIVQGQRLLVRTMKGDENVAPVAFTDTNVYSREVKSFRNMMLIADSFQSVSLHGFDAAPYRMITLGKDEQLVNVLAADFIVHDGNMYILLADDNSVFHLLQYDPYDPGSLKGLRLLRRSVLRTNGHTSHMISVARQESIFSMLDTLPTDAGVDLGYEIIGSNIDGSLYKVIPVNEVQYRRLYSIQNYLNDKELHWLGLNPKLNSIGGLSDLMPTIKRPFIELNMFQRFVNLNEDKKKLILTKLGKNSYLEFYKDLISLQ